MNNKNQKSGALAKVACYFDFENLHAALYDLKHGESSYQTNRWATQDAIFNLKAVMNYVAEFGEIVINRAYANWQFLSRYRDDLNDLGVDLVQLFPRGKFMKNGADIRLVLDVMEDIERFPFLTHIVINSSDSDFISLAQKVRQSGRTIIGVGVREATNGFWVKSCNEFKFYHELIEQSEALSNGQGVGKNTCPGEELLLRALKQLIRKKGENRVFKGVLKNTMRQIDSSFDENDFGFPNFGAFLDSFSDQVKIVDFENGGYVGLSKEIFEREFAANDLVKANEAAAQINGKATLDLAA
ncbi:MAG TPA: NYN domain-containing protein [Pyrinomonadaceae bacterium]|jgi:uncharacterized LabA/DUF88 family protein